MNILSIETGFFSTDGGAMFGIVPRKIWMRKYPADEENKPPMAMRCLLVCTPGRNILFDAGRGSVHVPGISYYRFTGEVGLSALLLQHGLKPEDITDVILSHLHFDHCGGLVDKTESGWAPAFPNATCWVGEGQLKNALNPTIWEKDAFVPELLETLIRAKKFKAISQDQEIAPGVEVRLFQGHTTDQLVSFIKGEKETVVFCGDVIPLEPHIHTTFVSAVDNSAQVAVDEKLRLLALCGDEQHLLFFYHDALTQAVKISNRSGRAVVTEKCTF